jgi:hypothetical protein
MNKAKSKKKTMMVKERLSILLRSIIKFVDYVRLRTNLENITLLSPAQQEQTKTTTTTSLN